MAIALLTIFLALGVTQTSRLVAATSSMEPNVHIDDLLTVSETYYSTHPVARFDIVAFRHPTTTFKAIARVIALGGETITIRNNKVFVNDKPLTESFKTLPCDQVASANFECADFGPFEVPDGEFFLLGDNRGDSLDSRLLRPRTVDANHILGKVVSIVSKKRSD